MLKSKLKIFGGVYLLIPLLIGVTILMGYSLVTRFSGFKETNEGVLFYMISLSAVLVIVYYEAYKNVYTMVLREDTITLKHLLFRKERIFSFQELEGYKTKIERTYTGAGSYKAIF